MLAISKSILKWWENGQYLNKRTYGFMSKTWFFSNTRYPKYPMILKINRVRIEYWKIFRVRVGYRVPVGPCSWTRMFSFRHFPNYLPQFEQLGPLFEKNVLHKRRNKILGKKSPILGTIMVNKRPTNNVDLAKHCQLSVMGCVLAHF